MHLILEKLELYDEDEELFATTTFLPVSRYREVRALLIERELMDPNGRIVGFEDSQTTPEAMRQKQWREKHAVTSNVTSDVTSNVTSHRDSRKQKAETNPTRAGRPAFDGNVNEAAQQVVDAVNVKFNTKRSATPTLKKVVASLFKAGYSSADIMLVVCHRLNSETWFDPQKWGPESLIRTTTFPSSLERALDTGGATKADSSPYLQY
jgi:hypothetical protein